MQPIKDAGGIVGCPADAVREVKQLSDYVCINKVIIYYYDQQDFELKVINLITLFGRDIVEKNMDDNKIIFIKIDSNID